MPLLLCRAHETTTAVAERGIGQVKRQFHVIIACAILHNICKARQIAEPTESDSDEDSDDDEDEEIIHLPQGNLAQGGLPYRAHFTNLHFRQVIVCYLKTCDCIDLMYHIFFLHIILL